MRSTAAAAVWFSPVEDPPDLDAFGRELVEELDRDIAQSIAELPRLGPPRKWEFSAETPVKARAAAVEWLRDFGRHGPLQIEALRTFGRGELFVAVLTCRSNQTIGHGALDEGATANGGSDEKSPAEPAPQSESSTAAPDPQPMHPFAFETPVVRKLPVVTPLQLGGGDSDQRVA
jgi:hypothetical protein